MGDYVNSAHADDESCMYALELLGGSIISMTVKAAIELGLVDELLAIAGGRALTAEELAARLKLPRATTAAAVDRMLRFLASYSVVRCTTETGPDGKPHRSYAAAPVCKWLAGSCGEAGSVAPLGLLNLDKVFMESWYSVKDALSEGETAFDKAYGMPMFEYLGQGANEASNTLFNKAMASHSAIITSKLLDFFRGFDGVDVLVDVGGGIGATLQMIMARHAHIRGINFDLPHVIAQAPPAEGLKHVGGSMFDYVPSGNAILLKWILHLWGDDDCAKILTNCYKALPANGKVIVLEYVLPATPEPTLAAQGAFRLDVVMLNRLVGGKERTEQEYTELAVKAGFSGECNATYIFTNIWTLEFTK